MRLPPPFRLGALLLGVALALGACQRGGDGPVRVTVIGGAPELGDPLMAPRDRGSELLRQSVAQGLVRLDAQGEIEGGMAERWNVSDDGLSYIFRLQSGEWPDGRKIVARDVARILDRQIQASQSDPVKDALGAVDEVVAMTDRVIEIRLAAPRPNLLPLLARPEFALIREGVGSGPFQAEDRERGRLTLERTLPATDDAEEGKERVMLMGQSAADAIKAFAGGQVDLVLGGTFADLPLATRAKLPRRALRFDPVAGLFGLAPARADGPLADPELRRMLSQAIDREAMIVALNVPGLTPRASLLQAGLAGVPEPTQPAWLDTPMPERRRILAGQVAGLLDGKEPPVMAVALPPGPGGDIVLARLAGDWGALGIRVERASKTRRADWKWVDLVAPSDSPAWFLRHFRCGIAPLCVERADQLLAGARAAPIAAQRAALLAEAARMMDEHLLFVPIAAPVRWSLVSDRVPGFAENRMASHPLTALATKSDPRRR